MTATKLTVALRVLRPLCVNGEPQAAGETINVDPLTASDILASGRAALVDLADLAAVKTAVWASARRATVQDRSIVGVLTNTTVR